MLINPKFSHYEDWQTKREVKQGIRDLEPFLIQFPTPPPIEQFINFGLPKNKQFFAYEEKPDWMYRVNKMRRSEAQATVKSNHYMAEWIDSQWRKRNEGVFMFVNGEPLHIPGKAWWYLNYYYQNTPKGVALGDFRFPDLEWWWIWCLFVMPSQNIFGTIDFTLRRDGKSARAMAETLEEITKTANVKGGIQSKTDKDAKDTFQEFIVEPWRRLPWFFSPKFDNKTYPSKELNFRDASISGDDLDASILSDATSEELGSSIEVRATVFNAFDGRMLRRYDLDEAAKIVEMDVYKAWEKHKQCLRVYDEIVGKAKITSTIEEMAKLGMIPFFKVWDESSREPEKMTSLNQTKSGLVPIFKAAHEAYLLDQFGRPIIDDPTPEQAEYRKKQLLSRGKELEVKQGLHLKGARELLEMEANSFTGKDRQDFLKMYPPSIAIARRMDSSECAFPAQIHIIEDRIDQLKYGLDDCYVGNLEWVVAMKEVRFVPCEHRDRQGKRFGYHCPSCMFRFFTMDFLPYTNNNYYDDKGFLCPGNKGKGLISADSFKYDVIKGKGGGSKAASHGFMEFDLNIDQGREHKDQVTDDFIYEFVYRTRTVDEFCEIMAMACIWLGWEIFPEINLANVWNWFVSNGMERFLKFPKALKKENGRYVIEESKTPGIVTLGTQSKLPTFAAVEKYLNTNGYKCNAIKFLQDCKDVEFNKLTEYDAFVSGSQCLYGRTPLIRYKPKVTEKPRTGLDGAFVLKRAGT